MITRLASIGLVVVLAGCVRMAQPPRLEGDLPRQQFARLNTQDLFLAVHHVRVVSLDGIPTVIQGSGKRSADIMPGVHTVDVLYDDATTRATEAARVVFEAHAGGEYEVQAKNIVFPPTLFGKGKWVAWVVDTRTDEVVGGVRPRDDPSTPETFEVDYPRNPFEITVVEPPAP